jgi:hypothetical protein
MLRPSEHVGGQTRHVPSWHEWGCIALMLTGLYLIVGPKIALSRWFVTTEGSTAAAEGVAWRKGTLELPKSFYEDAKFNGRHYNVVGLAFVILTVIGTTVTDWLGAGPDQFYAPLFVALVALPVPFLGYWAFRTAGRSPPWAAVLTVYLIAGTSLRPMLTRAGDSDIYAINHVLAVSGLLMLSADLLGKRRIWPSLVGLALAAWSRQTACFFAIPLIGLAASHQPGDAEPGSPLGPASPTTDGGAIEAPARSVRRGSHTLLAALTGVAIIAGVPMTLNWLKFGNPFDTGYQYVYAGRLDKIALDAHMQLFGPSYFVRHAKAMHAAYPVWDIRGGTLYPVTDDIEGGSIWLTSPLLLAVFTTLPYWWRDRRARGLMLASFLVMFAVMGYHTTGAQRAGYYRYSLDFIPIWLVVIAPYLSGRRGVPFTLGCLAYSALYFNIIQP